MTTQDHLKSVAKDLRAKEAIARRKSQDERTRADAFDEAATVIEVELTRLERFPPPRTPVA
jgi:hypothetical protein